MKSNYKRLGNYIRQVDVRNRDLVVNKLLGLSIAKQFITSIANTTGTDMSTYKIVQPRQFGYVPVTSRNGDKITIALYEGESPCIISQAYIVFEVIDETELLPEYLMMWFRRPEFDRYARFKSHGSAREVFEWSEMCDVMLPVPPIEEQRKIVSEYQAIEQRIENNRRLITTLEETAKAIYRKMLWMILTLKICQKGGGWVNLVKSLLYQVVNHYPTRLISKPMTINIQLLVHQVLSDTLVGIIKMNRLSLRVE